MKEQIIEELRRIEEEEDVTILNARERGSRMLGVSHSDSDWDGMFIFAQEPPAYAKLQGYTGTIDRPHIGPDEMIDLHGWNVDKFVRLLSDSNPNAVEYCRPDATEYLSFYDGRGCFTAIEQEIRDNWNHMSLYHHYLSMARSNYEKYVASGKDCTRGRQFYVMRAAALARYIRVVGELPAMNVYDFLDDAHPEALSDEEHDKLMVLADSKATGKGDKDQPDIVGNFLEAETDATMEPTDERVRSPDNFVLDGLIEVALDR